MSDTEAAAAALSSLGEAGNTSPTVRRSTRRARPLNLSSDESSPEAHKNKTKTNPTTAGLTKANATIAALRADKRALTGRVSELDAKLAKAFEDVKRRKDEVTRLDYTAFQEKRNASVYKGQVATLQKTIGLLSKDELAKENGRLKSDLEKASSTDASSSTKLTLFKDKLVAVKALAKESLAASKKDKGALERMTKKYNDIKHSKDHLIVAHKTGIKALKKTHKQELTNWW
jgi:chromosome segregation ATPase